MPWACIWPLFSAHVINQLNWGEKIDKLSFWAHRKQHPVSAVSCASSVLLGWPNLTVSTLIVYLMDCFLKWEHVMSTHSHSLWNSVYHLVLGVSEAQSPLKQPLKKWLNKPWFTGKKHGYSIPQYSEEQADSYNPACNCFCLPAFSLQPQWHSSRDSVLPLMPLHRAALIASAPSGEIGGCHVWRREHVLELCARAERRKEHTWLISRQIDCQLSISFSSFPPKVTQIGIHQRSQKGQVKD